MTAFLKRALALVTSKEGKKHVVAPANFQQVMRVYGLKEKEINKLEEKIRTQVRAHAVNG